MSDPVRADLVRLHGQNPDYMAGMSHEQKIATLAKISWQEFLLKYAKISPTRSCSFRGQGGRNNKRVDTTPALEAARRGSVGFNGLGMERDERVAEGSSYTFHFPDGNASIARLLVSRLVPAAFRAATLDMGTVVKAPLELRAARRGVVAGAHPAEQPRRSRTARRGSASGARPCRVSVGGKLYRVGGAHVILACNNAMIPALMPSCRTSRRRRSRTR